MEKFDPKTMKNIVKNNGVFRPPAAPRGWEEPE